MAVGFDFKERLGSGHFGDVWKAVDVGLKAIRAVKLIPPDKIINPTNFFQEAQILKMAEHPNVVQIVETGKMNDGRIYLSMEFLPKGSLEDEAKGAYVDLTRAKRLVIDVLRGLHHAHSRKILHRDLKPGNILIGNNNEGKLSDFGLAIPMGINFKKFGMKDYKYFMHLAPEVFHSNHYTVATDIYACGVTLYRLVNGDSYLPPLSPQDIFALAGQGKFPNRQHYREFIPRPLRMVINKALNIDPTKRYKSAEQMRHALEQVEVHKNWKETQLPNGYRWSCGWDERCYEVLRVQEANGTWTITVRKGRNKKSLRRITTFCGKALTKTKAEQKTRQILQEFVQGKFS